MKSVVLNNIEDLRLIAKARGNEAVFYIKNDIGDLTITKDFYYEGRLIIEMDHGTQYTNHKIQDINIKGGFINELFIVGCYGHITIDTSFKCNRLGVKDSNLVSLHTGFDYDSLIGTANIKSISLIELPEFKSICVEGKLLDFYVEKCPNLPKYFDKNEFTNMYVWIDTRPRNIDKSNKDLYKLLFDRFRKTKSKMRGV